VGDEASAGRHQFSHRSEWDSADDISK